MSNTKISSEQIIDGVALAGNPTTTTQSAGNNTTRVATTAFVTTAVANIVDSAPSALNTLNELAAALNDNASFFSTVLPLSGGTMTGALVIQGGNANNNDDANILSLTASQHARLVVDTSSTSGHRASLVLESNSQELVLSTTGSTSYLTNPTGSFNLQIATDKVINFAPNIGEIGNVTGFQATNTASSANTDFGIRATTIRLATGSAERVRVADTGLAVGSGFTPSALLHVNGSGDAVRVESTNTGSGGAQVDLLHFTSTPADNDIHAMINMGGYTSGTSSAYGSSIRSVWSDVSAKEAQLEFFTRDDSDFAARMVINKDGNINTSGKLGINEPSPDNFLHVNSGSTNVVAKFESTDGTAGILLQDNGGNVELSTASGNLQVQPSGGSSVFTVSTSGDVTMGTGAVNQAAKTLTSGGTTIIQGADSNHRIILRGTQDASGSVTGNANTMGFYEYGGYEFYTKQGNTRHKSLEILPAGKFNITTSAPRSKYFDVNGVAEISESFTLNNGVQYDFEYTVGSEGGAGNSYFIIAGYNHFFNASYGAHKVAFMSARTTSMNTMIDLGDQTSSGGGAWQFTKPTATTLRIRKTAGTYSGGGYGFIKVFFRNI